MKLGSSTSSPVNIALCRLVFSSTWDLVWGKVSYYSWGLVRNSTGELPHLELNLKS